MSNNNRRRNGNTNGNRNNNNRNRNTNDGTESEENTAALAARELEWSKCKAARDKFQRIVENITKARGQGRTFGPIQTRTTLDLLEGLGDQCRLSNQQDFGIDSAYYWGDCDEMIIKLGIADWADLKLAMENHESEADMQHTVNLIFEESSSNNKNSNNNIGGLGIDANVLANANIDIGDNEKWRFNARRRNLKKKERTNDRSRSREYGGTDDERRVRVCSQT